MIRPRIPFPIFVMSAALLLTLASAGAAAPARSSAPAIAPPPSRSRTPARTPASAPATKGVRSFLPVPVWYLDYEVEWDISDGQEGDWGTHL